MKKQKTKPTLGQYLKKYKFLIGLYIAINIIFSFCSIFETIFTANALEMITLKDFSGAIRLGLIVLLFIVVRRVSWYFASLVYNSFNTKIMTAISMDLAKQTFKLDSKTYTSHETGTFTQRVLSDPEHIVSSFTSLIEIITDTISALVMLIYITTLNLWISLIIIGVLVICFFIEKVRIKLRKNFRRAYREKFDKVNSLTTEIVRSEKDIKSLGLESKLATVTKENYTIYRKAGYKFDLTDKLIGNTRNFLIDLVACVILILGVVFIKQELLTLGAFIIIYSNSGSLYRFVFCIGSISNSIVDMKVCSERMFALFDEKEFTTEKFGKVNLEKVKGSIEFKKVGFVYREYSYEMPKQKDKKKNKKENSNKKKMPTVKKKLVSENRVFSNLSFKIKPNTTVAFVGKSGSGKSTILNLMSKMYEVDEGEVLIDKVNINDLNKDTLRRSISLVNQFPYIFDMTIKENLILAKEDATDQELLDAIEKASLKEFVDTLPNGINTKVGESGVKLSGGQKQRLAIARALLRKSSIIIFDESTSSLDNFAQEEVKKSIDNLKGQSTIVIVAHRLSTIKNVDTIFFLDNGEIVDSGTFNELFERNETFKKMFLIENL